MRRRPNVSGRTPDDGSAKAGDWCSGVRDSSVRSAQPSQRHKYLHNSHQLLSPQVRGARRRNPPPQQLTASQKLVRKQDSPHQTCYACGRTGGAGECVLLWQLGQLEQKETRV